MPEARHLRAREGARVGAGHIRKARRAPLAARPRRQRGAPPQAVAVLVARSALGRGAARDGRGWARAVGASGHEAHACRIVGRDWSGEAGSQQEKKYAHAHVSLKTVQLVIGFPTSGNFQNWN